MWGPEGKVLAAWLSLPLGLDSGHHPGTEQLFTVVPSTPILSSPLGPWLSAPLSQEFVALQGVSLNWQQHNPTWLP